MAAESKAKHIINLILRYTVLILVGFVMVYPLLWMVGATFKSNAEIFSSIGLLQRIQAWKDIRQQCRIMVVRSTYGKRCLTHSPM